MQKIVIDVIAVQEVWEVRQPEILSIPGFQTFVYKTRSNMRGGGGGVGFYVREGLTFKIIENLSPFEQKIFEAITIQVSYPNKTMLLTSAYHSNGPLPNLTATQQIDRFHISFGELLSKLNSSRLTSYVFIDSNINLLNMYSEDASQFINNVLSNGFIQQVMKATRFQNHSKTLLGQILTSSNSNEIFSGTIVSDVSDNFFTFTGPVLPPVKKNSQNYLLPQFFSQQFEQL
jgi:hypothetical protein